MLSIDGAELDKFKIAYLQGMDIHANKAVTLQHGSKFAPLGYTNALLTPRFVH